jgi:hypothetical protein
VNRLRLRKSRHGPANAGKRHSRLPPCHEVA